MLMEPFQDSVNTAFDEGHKQMLEAYGQQYEIDEQRQLELKQQFKSILYACHGSSECYLLTSALTHFLTNFIDAVAKMKKSDVEGLLDAYKNQIN